MDDPDFDPPPQAATVAVSRTIVKARSVWRTLTSLKSSATVRTADENAMRTLVGLSLIAFS